jgi:hypothetical protein
MSYPETFKNFIEFSCGCIAIDTTNAAGEYLVLLDCDHTSVLQWKRMNDTPVKTRSLDSEFLATDLRILSAISDIQRLCRLGREFQKVKDLLKKD